MLLTRLLIVSILFFNTLYDNPKDKTIFISPLKIPLLLSANFGELRIDHFHSGLDIKTQGVTGKEVVAAADGYIFRISVSPGGFGKALYIRHPSGYETVYGHLDRFTREVEDYVATRQYEEKSYTVAIFPDKEKFPVKQGETIAWSGNSGASGGAHLHYEIRKSENEFPVNPLLFEYGITDKIKPVIEKLAIYPINRYSLINNQHIVKKINVSGSNGKYYISPENEISITGVAGFGIKAFDLLDDSYNKCAVYSIELKIDSIPVFKYVMDGFSFSESRYINSHIDYETYMRENIYIERAYVLPNDKLSVYKDITNRGTFNFKDDKIHHAQISVTDVQNNKSSLSFNIKSQSTKSQSIAEPTDNNMKLMPFNRSNKFVSENISVNIPGGALYDTIYFSYKKTPGTKEMLSDLHYVNDIFTPINKTYTLSIKPAKIPAGKQSKMLIVQYIDELKRNAIKSTWNESYLSAEVSSFGKFYIGIDTVAPVISTNGLVNGAIITGRKELKINITDDFSGIKSYEPYIDGKWALFAYDPKNNVIIYSFDERRLSKGIKHSMRLKVTDNTDNISFFNCDFTW
ncbi:MAG TPA: M23 family metallopeptidase [Bacteroidales bacterium]